MGWVCFSARKLKEVTTLACLWSAFSSIQKQMTGHRNWHQIQKYMGFTRDAMARGVPSSLSYRLITTEVAMFSSTVFEGKIVSMVRVPGKNAT